MRSAKHTLQKNKRKKRLEVFLSIVLLLTVGLGTVVGYYGSKVASFLDDISVADDDNDENLLQNSQQLENLEPFSVLILGTDIEDGASRSDTIIVATINPDSNDIKMISIPRDTLITMPDGTNEKINAAYATGGVDFARQTVSDYLDIPIHFYAQLDFDGLVELVDAVGGITVDSELEFSQSDYTTPGNTINIVEGEQELDGAGALAYARMRKKDPRGDFGRQDRQQEVIIGVLNELLSFGTVTNITKVLGSVSPYLQTNATVQQMLSIATNYSSTASNVERLTLTGNASNMYFPHYGQEVYVWEADEESKEEVHEELQNHLDYDGSSKADSFDVNKLTPSTSDTDSVQ